MKQIDQNHTECWVASTNILTVTTTITASRVKEPWENKSAILPVESGVVKILMPTRKRIKLCQSPSNSHRHKFHFPKRLSKVRVTYFGFLYHREQVQTWRWTESVHSQTQQTTSQGTRWRTYWRIGRSIGRSSFVLRTKTGIQTRTKAEMPSHSYRNCNTPRAHCVGSIHVRGRRASV